MVPRAPTRVIFGSVCSGIEAASVAWEPLGWRAAWYAEVDPFASAVLAHHFPAVENRGDFTRISGEANGTIDLLVGGTPCQSFSIAGRRAGLDDPRGNLTLEYLALARRIRARWLVWENVAGILSDDGGRTFGTILGIMGELGYGIAYRILDAQHFGVPQRRRRVFVVGCLGNWRRPAAVLFERASLSGNSPPRGEARAGASGAFEESAPEGGDSERLIAGPLTVRRAGDPQPEGLNGTVVADPITVTEGKTYTHEGRNNFRLRNVVAFDPTQLTHPENRARCDPDGPSPSLAKLASAPAIAEIERSTVRRLTPLECERLQGFPDHFTAIEYNRKPAKDGPRYKALGNSMAVPVMRWIGERIAAVEKIGDIDPASLEALRAHARKLGKSY